MTDTFLLPNGRTLGYAITGDPAGPPAFYFHGWPASRLEAALVDDLPIRLIAVDRPGYGGSTEQPGRRLVDWPADVEALADHLGIDQFHVVGVSGGAPYALACAAMLDRVIAAALISPVPPLAGSHAPSTKALGEGLLQLRRMGEHAWIGWAVMSSVRLAIQTGLFDPRNALEAGFSPRDAACVTPDLKLRLVDAWREGLRQGVAGALSDARIYASEWGFDLADIRTPVSIWHGTEDAVVPAGTLPAYAGLAAQWHILEGEGHYSLALTRTSEVVADMVHA